jgi:hypothetical protein
VAVTLLIKSGLTDGKFTVLLTGEINLLTVPD